MKLSRRTICPSCEVGLKVADTLAAGKMIKCPKCGSGFRLSFIEDEPAAPKAAQNRLRKRVPRPAPPPEEETFDDEVDEPRPVRKKLRRKKKKPASNTLLIVGLILGAVLLLGGAGTLVVLFLFPSKKTETVAQNTTKQGEAGDRREAGAPEPDQRAERRRSGPGPGAGGDAMEGEAGFGGGGGGVSQQFAAGKAVFDRSCARCHSDGTTGGGGGGQGGRRGGGRGPNLSRVGRNPAHTVAWFMKIVREPQSVQPESNMPRFPANRISDADLRTLADYLVSLK
jgi:mono/diheme cytochrome c family protein